MKQNTEWETRPRLVSAGATYIWIMCAWLAISPTASAEPLFTVEMQSKNPYAIVIDAFDKESGSFTLSENNMPWSLEQDPPTWDTGHAFNH